MPEAPDVDSTLRDLKVDRKLFENALRKLLDQPPAPHALVSLRVERERRQARIRAKLQAEHSRET